MEWGIIELIVMFIAFLVSLKIAYASLRITYVGLGIGIIVILGAFLAVLGFRFIAIWIEYLVGLGVGTIVICTALLVGFRSGYKRVRKWMEKRKQKKVK